MNNCVGLRSLVNQKLKKPAPIEKQSTVKNVNSVVFVASFVLFWLRKAIKSRFSVIFVFFNNHLFFVLFFFFVQKSILTKNIAVKYFCEILLGDNVLDCFCRKQKKINAKVVIKK